MQILGTSSLGLSLSSPPFQANLAGSSYKPTKGGSSWQSFRDFANLKYNLSWQMPTYNDLYTSYIISSALNKLILFS